MRGPLAVLLLLLAAPAAAQDAAQDAPPLRAAMLGANETEGRRADEPTWGRSAASSALPLPVDGASFGRFHSSTPPDTTLHDPWLGRDKALHTGGSFLLTLSGQYVLTAKLAASEGTALPIAAGTTLALGLTKEILDSRRTARPHFSTRDLVADAVGVALAVGLILL